MMTKVTGNTYPVKDALRALGGRWEPWSKSWVVPDDKAEAAQKLVAGSGPAKPKTGRAPRVCRTCGCKINYGVYCGKCEYS